MQSFSVPCSLIFPPPLVVEQMFTFVGVTDVLISTLGGYLSIPLVPEVLLTLCPVGGYTWGARLWFFQLLIFYSILSGQQNSCLFAIHLSRYCWNKQHLGVSYQRVIEHTELTGIREKG